MKKRDFVVSLVLGIFILSGCSATLHPAITATVNQNVNSLTISGTGFSPTNPCARLSLLGLPPPYSATGIGNVNCSGGSFQNFNWTPNYVPGCQPDPNSPQNVNVTAVDLQTSNPAFANPLPSIWWGPNCTLVGTCGKIGQYACPNSSFACYVDGGVDSSGKCVPCGKEGQPACTNAPQCENSLHLNGIGSSAVCTATCGHTNQNACVTDGSAMGVTYLYHCYAGSTIDSSCVCVFDPNPSPCQEINSGNTGVCLAVIRIPPQGQSSCQ